MSQEKLMKAKDVAERLDVHEETVRKWLRTGEMQGVFLGRRGGYRISEEALAAFEASRTKKLAA